MDIREYIIEKVKSLPEDRLEEIANFIELLEAKEKGYPELAEYGMEDYLSQLSTYAVIFTAENIGWREEGGIFS